MEMKLTRLILIRHARAEPAAPGGADQQRALSPDGRAQCAALRAWLQPRLDGDETLLVSPARRTRQTAERALGAWPAARTHLDERLWAASGEDLRAVLAEQRGAVVLVGHNPGLEQLQHALSGRLRPLGTGSAIELDLAGDRPRVVEVFQPPSDST